MDEAQALAAEIEALAARLEIAPSTVGERAGQGGRFYKRLKDGKRVWPDTAKRVRERLALMASEAPCESSHGHFVADCKGDVA
jgi:hypothetical protein